MDIEGTARAYLKKQYKLSDEKITPMLAGVQKSLPELLKRALDENSRRAWTELGNTAHALKGQLLTMGLAELAEQARTVELAARAGEDGDYSGHLQRLNAGLGEWGIRSQESGNRGQGTEG